MSQRRSAVYSLTRGLVYSVADFGPFCVSAYRCVLSKKKVLKTILLVLSVLLTTVQSLEGKEKSNLAEFGDEIE